MTPPPYISATLLYIDAPDMRPPTLNDRKDELDWHFGNDGGHKYTQIWSVQRQKVIRRQFKLLALLS
jgi:hypothetical protein